MTDHYPDRRITRPEAVWGEGVLSPGGQGEAGRLRGPLGGWAADRVGQDFVNHSIAIWDRMIPVLDSGEQCPTHLAGQKP